jgi:hypothetical protein
MANSFFIFHEIQQMDLAFVIDVTFVTHVNLYGDENFPQSKPRLLIPQVPMEPWVCTYILYLSLCNNHK